MAITRRKALSISGSTLAGLSLGLLRPETLQATLASGQQDWPDELVERPLRDGVSGAASPQRRRLSSRASSERRGADHRPADVAYRRPPNAPDRVRLSTDADQGGYARSRAAHRNVALLGSGATAVRVSHVSPAVRRAQPSRHREVGPGVRFSDYADMLGLIPEAHYCRFVASDRFYADEPLTTLRHPQVMLAWLMNDEPIPPRHGAPLRLIIPLPVRESECQSDHGK